MTKMEIASYLAIIQVGIAQGKRGDRTTESCLEAIREAQMIMYSLALTEVAEQIKEKNDGGDRT